MPVSYAFTQVVVTLLCSLCSVSTVTIFHELLIIEALGKGIYNVAHLFTGICDTFGKNE